MKVLITITAYPPAVGGAQIYTHALARHLVQEQGLEVHVVCQWSENRTDWLLGTTVRAPAEDERYELDGVRVTRLGLGRRERAAMLPLVFLYPLLQRRAVAALGRRFRDRLAGIGGRPDLIHNVRVGREGLSVGSWLLARSLEVPFVLMPVHHPRWTSRWHREFLRLYRKADGLVALTDWERRLFRELGVSGDRIQVTGIGPVLARTGDGDRFRATHGLTGLPVVLFLGQQYRYKGVAELANAMLEVWTTLPEARLVIMGPRTAWSRRMLAKLQDPRVLDLGALSLQEKTDALAACEVLCVPSAQESFGGVFTEAWTMGKPVIGGPAPAIREVISDGYDGFVVPQAPAAIADRLRYLLVNAQERRRMGERGRMKVEDRYTWGRLTGLVADFYRRLAARAREG